MIGIFFITQASADIASNGSLIQTYLKAHPIDKKALKQMQEDIVQKFTQLSDEIAATVQNADPYAVALPSLYPVRSTKLTPGNVRTRQTDFNLPQPVFIVGEDDQSKAWLLRYEKQLEQLHAQGFVVNVSNASSMEFLQAMVPDLSLLPLPGDVLAVGLHLQHYPVLITCHWIEQ